VRFTRLWRVLRAGEDAMTKRPPSDLWGGIWRVADPKITLASVASMIVGLGAALHDGAVSWPWFALTVLGIFFVEAAKNTSGEIFDFDSGTDLRVAAEDRSPFSGGKRILVDRMMTRRQAKGVALICYGLGMVMGLAIVALREPRVIWFGLAGFFLAYFYHAPPLRLAYRGLGELAVALAYGPLTAAGTYLVQHHRVAGNVLLLSLPVGLQIAAFLWINEFPDAKADEASGKRTLVVRLGRRRASRAFVGLVATAFLTLIALPAFGVPATVWLGLAGLPLAVRAARRLWSASERTAEVVPAQGWTLLSFLLLAVGSAVGLVIARQLG
jgi:1,4-dihydroxy-2-naphthoate octaprenyltransferase